MLFAFIIVILSYIAYDFAKDLKRLCQYLGEQNGQEYHED